jgi:energy-coupling factor transporter ATP-binding protein EcfA2
MANAATATATQSQPKATATAAPGARSTQATAAASTVDPTKQVNAVQAKGNFVVRPMGARQKYLKALVYGPHGSGKTTLLASAADVDEMADVFLVNAESGDMVIEDNDRIEHVERIFEASCHDFDQAANMLNFLRAHCRAREAGDKKRLVQIESQVTGTPTSEIKEPRQFQTVIVDSLTEIDRYCTYKVLGIDPDALQKVADAEVAGWSEFRKNNQMMQILLRAYRDLPMNVLFAAPATYSEDESKRKYWQPAVTGQLARQVQGFVDIVGYLVSGAIQEIEGSEGDVQAPRRMYLQPTPKFAAKNRKASFKKPHIDDPTMSSIVEALGLKL